MELVRTLGVEAVEEFLTDLGPHLDAVRSGDEGSHEALRSFLDEVVISANAVQQLGGVAAVKALGQQGQTESGFTIAPEHVDDLPSILAEQF